MLFILFSLFCWLFLWYIGSNNPIRLCSRIKECGGSGGGETEVVSHTYYYYKVRSPHNSVDPSQPILCYDAFGTLIFTIPPYDSNMNYGDGVYTVPGNEQNTVIESISTATYYIFYSIGDLIIDYDKAEFKIAKKLIRSTAQTDVKATFQYLSVITPFKDVASVIDGRWDTQVQTEFFAEPPTGYNYSILDLGSIKNIQAIDIVAGFYKPDDIRKFDVDFNMSFQYSLNGTDYYNISDKTHNVQFTGGSSQKFEEEDLGIDFQARYLKLILENVKKLDFGQVKDASGTVIREGVFVVALTEIAAYDNIIIKSEATLIPTTELTQDIDLTGLSSGSFPTVINVLDTSQFSSSGTAYIWNGINTYDTFTYTGKGASFFYGVSGLSESHTSEEKVVQSIEGDATIYDEEYLRSKLGDRIFKQNKANDNTLFNQGQLDYVAKKYLQEFKKNHTKCQVEVMYSPFLEIGQTLLVVDAVHNINRRYFIEAINTNNMSTTLILAYYP